MWIDKSDSKSYGNVGQFSTEILGLNFFFFPYGVVP